MDDSQLTATTPTPQAADSKHAADSNMHSTAQHSITQRGRVGQFAADIVGCPLQRTRGCDECEQAGGQQADLVAEEAVLHVASVLTTNNKQHSTNQHNTQGATVRQADRHTRPTAVSEQASSRVADSAPWLLQCCAVQACVVCRCCGPHPLSLGKPARHQARQRCGGLIVH